MRRKGQDWKRFSSRTYTSVTSGEKQKEVSQGPRAPGFDPTVNGVAIHPDRKTRGEAGLVSMHMCACVCM